MSETNQTEWIPNIILGQDYDRRYLDASIHYDVLENLAAFYGRDMPVHRHAQYVQIHYIDRGVIDFHIDDKVYEVIGPSCFFTPASIPHSFRTDPSARGHVLTIHQSLAWQLMQDNVSREINTSLTEAICLERDRLPDEQKTQWTLLNSILEDIQLEWSGNQAAKELALESLVRLLLIRLARLSFKRSASRTVDNEDLRLFRRFTDIIEEHYQEQWHLPRYTAEMAISESRLNQTCQRIANTSPKKLIHDRVIQESKRMLIFSNLSSNEICYQLGFSDPAYFSRFFKKQTGMTTQKFRRHTALRRTH
ncbi:4-hydroxyphenylacetate catabolism regulatory protein HpaA [Marinobacter sediminum]|uniref:4-hydroxyphenylacetate catabolism regulatory protein HpaA n=1 Tax=Marinobacter sediminum TaxID=256323 RepID=UPI002030CFCF|nr:4-hydroxyphenylacetate catabolism regulatory protein HpaA [Marinobacter sediminum]MCM0611494.1 4-hydroxyphenylacetate catabolism regulatory protein HpaA [Marinobacter sediminum]